MQRDVFSAPGILKTKEYKVWVSGVLVPGLILFYPMSSSFPSLKSQTDASAGISTLANCCQRAGWFVCWPHDDFHGLLAQSGFRLARKLFLHGLFGGLSGYGVCSEEISFDLKNCLSHGWIPFLGTNHTQPSVYSSTCMTV